MDAPPASDGLDELTGLNGRRLFFEQAQAAFNEAARAGRECAAAIVDLDRLELVNDTFGHHTGTELIRETAAALEAVALEGDVIGRLGGDEFALFRSSGVTTEEKIASQLAAAAERGSGGARHFALDISVGVAVERADGIDSLDALMAAADDAMYEHKRAGGGTIGAPHARRRARR